MRILFNQAGYTLVFGFLSFLLGFAQYKVPGVEGVYSDLREIPLLISLIYLRNPLFIIPLSLITSLSYFFQPDTHFTTTFLMHLSGLLVSWMFYQYFDKKNLPLSNQIVFWILWVIFYYIGLVIPVMLLAEIFISGNTIGYWEGYKTTSIASAFEILSTLMVTSIYLIQYSARKDLQQTNLNLETIVNLRTQELVSANENLKNLNEKLYASNEEITLLNENLEALVLERTERVKTQLAKLQAYAHTNSHEVRGPLARILGLMNLLDKENDLSKKLECIELIKIASFELDSIVRKMNRILEEEELGNPL